jgi:hypothetical protein
VPAPLLKDVALSPPRQKMNNCVQYNPSAQQWTAHCPHYGFDHRIPSCGAFPPGHHLRPIQNNPILSVQPPNLDPQPLYRQVHERIKFIEHQKFASSMESSPGTRAKEKSLLDSKRLESHVEDAAHQFNQLKGEVARLASLMKSRDDAWDQTQASHDQILSSLRRIQASQGHIEMRQDQIQNSQDQINSHISRQQEETGTKMNIPVREMSNLHASQSHALAATGSGLSINGGSSRRKGANRTTPTQTRKRKLIHNTVQSKGEESGGGTRRRSSRLAGTAL